MDEIEQSKKLLKKAIKLHKGHMDGSVPTSDKSQMELMNLTKNALELLGGNMDEMEIKKKVLQEMMDLMDEKEGDKLKSHPKMMALNIESSKSHKMPDGSMMDDDEMSEDPSEEKLESPDEEKQEDSHEMEDGSMMSDDELSPEMIKKLLEMYKNSK